MRTEIGAARGSSAVWRVLEDELARVRAGGTAEPHVVDVGGGTGVWAVPLAAAGCRVTVVEPNQNALATLRRRAREREVADRIDVVADDTDALRDHVREGSAELVLAHGLFEVVDDPNRAAAALAATVVPGGAVSVLAANRFAAVLHRALAGRLTEARHLLTAPTVSCPTMGRASCAASTARACGRYWSRRAWSWRCCRATAWCPTRWARRSRGSSARTS